MSGRSSPPWGFAAHPSPPPATSPPTPHHLAVLSLPVPLPSGVSEPSSCSSSAFPGSRTQADTWVHGRTHGNGPWRAAQEPRLPAEPAGPRRRGPRPPGAGTPPRGVGFPFSGDPGRRGTLGFTLSLAIRRVEMMCLLCLNYSLSWGWTTQGSSTASPTYKMEVSLFFFHVCEVFFFLLAKDINSFVANISHLFLFF